MGLRISTNVASLSAQRQLGSTQRGLENTIKSLASGTRFTDASANPAEFSISEHLKGQISGMRAARDNADNAFNFVQVAEGGLNEQNNILVRLRELAIQAASDTFSDTERDFLDSEFQQLSTEFDRIAKTTSYGSNKLLSGDSKDYEFQIGAYKGDDNVLKFTSDTDTTAGNLNVDSLGVKDKGDARDALETIDDAMVKIASARANFGAVQSRLQSISNSSSDQVENLSVAQSRIADTDVARSVSDMARLQALQAYQVSVLNQANQMPGQLVRLVG